MYEDEIVMLGVIIMKVRAPPRKRMLADAKIHGRLDRQIDTHFSYLSLTSVLSISSNYRYVILALISF